MDLKFQPHIQRHLGRHVIPSRGFHNRDMKPLELPLYLLHVALCIPLRREREVQTQHKRCEDLFHLHFSEFEPNAGAAASEKRHHVGVHARKMHTILDS